MEECSSGKNMLTLGELVLLNCMVCGFELVASVALSYLPPMLLEAGFSEEYMSWVLMLGPCICLIVVPIVGQWMDTCTSRYGRRIPFMFFFSVLVLISLLLVPYTDHMASTGNENEKGGSSIHLYLLAFSVVLIDFGTQAGLTPCEVFLQDVTAGSPMRDRAFGLYSFMCSLGSCSGFLILTVPWESTWVGSLFGDHEYCIFFLIFCIFLCLVIANLRMASMIRSRLSAVQSKSLVDLQKLASNSNLSKGNQTSGKSPTRLADLKRLVAMVTPRGIQSLFNIPYALRRLVFANFFSWAAVMCFLLFYTDYIGEVVYGGKPNAMVGTPARSLFDEGVRMGGFGLFLHAVLSSCAAPLIENMINKYGMRKIHLTALFTFTLCLTLVQLSSSLIIINGLAMMCGFAFASMTTIPFSLLGLYHERPEEFFPDSLDPSGRGLGSDMATLDAAYFSSQILLLSMMGYLVHLTRTAATFLRSACVLGGIACYFIYTAVYTPDDIPPHVKNSFITDELNAITVTITKPLDSRK